MSGVRLILLAIAVAAGAAMYAWRPVCVPIDADTLAGFDPPIASRTDRDFYVKVFRQRDGQWHQCKTWLSRQLFF